MKTLALTLSLAACLTVGLAAAIDVRLSHVRTVFVEPVDDLGDDRPVAACFVDHLAKETPMTAVARDEAPVIVKIAAHLPGETARRTFGNLGTVSIRVEMKDGSLIWSGDTFLQQPRTAQRLRVEEIPCGLADAIADKLRQAMKRSRDAK